MPLKLFRLFSKLIKNQNLNYLKALPFITLLFVYGCSSSVRFTSNNNFGSRYNNSSSHQSEKNIRVLLATIKNSTTLRNDNSVDIFNSDGSLLINHTNENLYISVKSDKIILTCGRSFFEADEFVIEPVDRYYFLDFSGKKYRGDLIFKYVDSSIYIINDISIYDYLKGVVPAEMPVSGGESYLEALKAFAICARTYAVNKIAEGKSSFDVYDDMRDQVYGGVDLEQKISDQAVDETKNLILIYNNEPALVFYCSSCGGHTENASEVFGVKDAPYLQGVEDDNPPYCSTAPDFNWEEKYTEHEFIEFLVKADQISSSDYNLENIRIVDRDASGRVSNLEISLRNNGDDKVINLYGNKIREIRRTSSNGILKSTMFNIKFENDYVIINGKGNGHGVGLCQWGAIHQSELGRSYTQILDFYFPGTQIRSL
jgi:stage II sporulation protein D (peptidoglycan lytic transglycosylase)